MTTFETLGFFPVAAPTMLMAGGAATAGPVIIHLLNRTRVRPIEWAAMEFLLESIKKSRRRMQIEEFLLLLLRMLLLFLLALALSKPLLKLPESIEDHEIPPDAAGRRADHFLIIDDSVSTGQVTRGQTAFEAIKQHAKEFLTKLGTPDHRLDTITILRVGQFDAADLPPVVADLQEMKLPDTIRMPEAPPTVNKKGIQTGPATRDAKKSLSDIYKPDALFVTVNQPEDAQELVKLVDGFAVSDNASRMDLALRAVKELIADSKRSQNPNKRVYVISDFREHDFGRGTGHGGLLVQQLLREFDAKSTRVLLQDAGADDTKNIGISRFAVANTTAIVGVENRLEVTVRNYNPLARVAGRELKVSITDEKGNVLAGPREVKRDLDAAGTTRVVEGQTLRTDQVTEMFDLSLDKPGLTALVAKVDFAGDTLAADNRAYLSLDVRPNLSVLLVHDDVAGAVGKRKSTRFLRLAVDFTAADNEKRLLATQQGLANVRRLNGVRADERSLSGSTDKRGRLNFGDYGLVMIADVGRLEDRGAGRGSAERVVAELEDYVRNGGNVVFFLGEQVDPKFYNQYLYREGAGLLPVQLAEVFRDAALIRRMVAVDGDHPVFGRYKTDPDMAKYFTQEVRVNRYWLLAGNKPAPGARVLVTFDDPAGSPAWVERPFGNGKVLVFLSSPDTSWTNLPRQLVFPIVMTEILAYLAQRGQLLEGRRVGSPIDVTIPDEVAAAGRTVRLLGPPDPSATFPGRTVNSGLIDFGRLPLYSEKNPDGKVVRNYVRVSFPYREAGGVVHPPRAGFYKVDWSEGAAPAGGGARLDDEPSILGALVDRNLDPSESELTRAEKIGELIADLKAEDGQPLVRFQAAVDPNTGRASVADPDVFEPAKPNSDKQKEHEENLPVFYSVMAALLVLMLVEQFLAYVFSHHEK